jgi:hypothetical protein
MPSIINPEERLWRTDIRKGRAIYALMSNDPTRPSDDDTLIGVMESSIVAENVVSTHNGVLALYGRRYPQVLADAEINPPDQPQKEVFRFYRSELDQVEHAHLLAIMGWLHKGPLGSTPVVEKVYRALGGKDD